MDDQSYNLPSKEFPRLPTEKKSYSFEEVAEFNRYAQARGVILVPELEIPGHASIFNEAYPEIFMNHLEENAGGMVTENGDAIDPKSVICVGSKKAEEALSRLLTELCELFPHTPYIHIGGDEADSKVWDSCTVCKNYMKEHGLSDVGELYCDFTARIASLVLKNGRTPIVWEGFPKKGAERIPKETIVIAWESYYHTAPDLIEEGFRIINASWQPLYIVQSLVRRWYAKDILSWDVYNLQHWWEESLASKNQIHLSPTDQVLGAQICSWGCSFEQEIGLLLENLPALSERTWNTDGKFEMNETLEAMEPLLSLASRLIENT
jgi:hexosaminidase